MDFSRAAAALIAASGNATSISFFLIARAASWKSRKDPRLPFAGTAVVVAVHAPLIRTMATRDAVGMIAP